MAAPSSGIVSLRSSVFTATADARYRGALVLVRISLPAYGLAPARTLHLTNAAYSTGRWYVDPDGQPWDPALAMAPSIDHGGSWLTPHYQPCDAIVTVQDRRIGGQADGEVFSTLLADYPFIGARVEILQAFDNLTSTSEFATIFEGKIAQIDSLTLDGVVFSCVQDRSWSVQLPPRVVTADDFEDAPKAVLGTAIPIVLGDWETRNRYLDSDGYSGTAEAVYAGLARGACPMLPISSPLGAALALPKHLISDDEIDQGPLSGGAPYDQFYMYEPALDCLVGPGLGTLANPTDGPATTTLLSTQVTGAVIPIEVNALTNCDDAEWCLRKDKRPDLGPGYAYLNHNSGKTTLVLDLPDIASLGKFVAAAVRVYYQKPLTTGTQILLQVYNTAVPGGTPGSITNASTGYVSDGFEQVKTYAVDPNEITSWEDIKNCYIEIRTRAANQEIKIHHVVLDIDYIAQGRTERPGTTRDTFALTPGTYGNIPGRERRVAMHGGTITSPDLVTFDSTLYGFPRGRKDTAAGIYTGTPDALIEHPVDMVRYLLRRWCGVSSGELVENSGDFGSFLDAKAAFTSYKFRTIISNRSEAENHIAAIGAESLIWFKKCPTLPNAPWVAVPWELGSPVNYRSASEPFIFSRADQHVVRGSFKVGQTKISNVANTVRVNYDWDPRTNSYGDQLYITPTGSRIHFIGTVFGADTTREADAAASALIYGANELVISLKMVNDPGTASSILQRLFDLRVEPHLTVDFRTFVNAYGLNRGHVIGFNADWDTRLKYPKAGSDGTWDGKLFRVVNVKRFQASPAEYGVQAVEI